LLHLVGYLYYWQMGFNSVFKGLSEYDHLVRSNSSLHDIVIKDILLLDIMKILALDIVKIF